MCDTIVIVRPDRVLFAKNSDRDANEGQNLEWHPRRTNAPGATVQCTYIAIPDVAETNAVLLSSPFWMWGAEMGANEHGVVIGNEAVFTKEPYEKKPGLIGMDLLRLALERADTALDACGVITSLLEEYGQGGGCGHESRKFTYHNSFIVADSTSAYVLETAGRKWAREEVHGARTISNGLTIPGFRERFSDTIKTTVSGCLLRRERTQILAEGSANAADLMGILRDHGDGAEHPQYAFMNGGLNAPCVHAGGILASSQTTASWVADLRPTQTQHWATGTAATCISLFKPVNIDDPVALTPRAEDTANDSLWWRHEVLHRAVMRNPGALRRVFMDELETVQQRWLQDPPASAEAFAEGDRLLVEWTRYVLAKRRTVEGFDRRPGWVQRYWRKRNKRSGLWDKAEDFLRPHEAPGQVR